MFCHWKSRERQAERKTQEVVSLRFYRRLHSTFKDPLDFLLLCDDKAICLKQPKAKFNPDFHRELIIGVLFSAIAMNPRT